MESSNDVSKVFAGKTTEDKKGPLKIVHTRNECPFSTSYFEKCPVIQQDCAFYGEYYCGATNCSIRSMEKDTCPILNGGILITADDTLKSSARGIELVEMSREHWKQLVLEPFSVGHGPEDCPLCKEYSHCKNCPVAEHTGQSSCRATPWTKAHRAFVDLRESKEALSRGIMFSRDWNVQVEVFSNRLKHWKKCAAEMRSCLAEVLVKLKGE